MVLELLKITTSKMFKMAMNKEETHQAMPKLTAAKTRTMETKVARMSTLRTECKSQYSTRRAPWTYVTPACASPSTPCRELSSGLILNVKMPRRAQTLSLEKLKP